MGNTASQMDYDAKFDIWVKTNNIIFEKVDLFRDFCLALLDTIKETYLGSDVLKDEEDIKKHFMWCFNTVISNFNKEKIHFKSDGEIYEYFWYFFYDAFYLKPDSNQPLKIEEYFLDIFNLKKNKIGIEIIILTQIYKMLDQSLIK